MYDALLIAQSLTTVTAVRNGSGVDLETGTPRRGLKMRFLITSHIAVGTAGNVFTPQVWDSDDNTTFTLLSAGTPQTGATAATTNQIVFVPFETSRRYIRASMAQSVTSGTPSISYSADIGVARP